MAKKKDREKGKGSRTDAVRSAVDQAFQATAGAGAALTRDRATDIADELTGVVARLRDTLDENRPASGEDLRTLRLEVAALTVRVAALEAAEPVLAPAPKAPPRARAATTQAAAKRAQAAARKPAAKAGTAPGRTSAAASGPSKTPSAGSAADADLGRASTAARTTRARAAAGGAKRPSSKSSS